MSDPSAINDSWPEEKIAKLRELVEAGHGSPEISKLMGITRNAVCGKAQRLDLRFRGTAAHKTPHGPRKPRKPHRAGAVTLPQMQRWCAQCGGTLGAEQERFCSNGCHLIHLAAHRPAPKPVVRAPKPQAPEILRRDFGPVRQCCFPLNDGRPWKFCGDASEPGKSYCAKHWRIAHVPARHAEEREAA